MLNSLTGHNEILQSYCYTSRVEQYTLDQLAKLEFVLMELIELLLFPNTQSSNYLIVQSSQKTAVESVSVMAK